MPSYNVKAANEQTCMYFKRSSTDTRTNDGAESVDRYSQMRDGGVAGTEKGESAIK